MLYEFLGGLNVFITKESKIVDNKVFCSATPLPKKKNFFCRGLNFFNSSKIDEAIVQNRTKKLLPGE